MWKQWNTAVETALFTHDKFARYITVGMARISHYAVRLITAALLLLPMDVSYAVDFGEVLLGIEATRAVFAPEDADGDTRWRVLRRVSPPFTLSSEIPIDLAGSRAWLCAFQPLSKGEFRDSAVILRLEGRSVVDTITIVFTGSGRSLTTTQQVQFFTALTGDVQEKRIDVYGPAYVVADYALHRNVSQPFQIDTSGGVLRADPDDSLEVRVRFQPTVQGSYFDTLRLIRWHQQLVPLDTLTLVLQATAVQMRADTTVVVRDAMVGSTDTTVIFLRLPSFVIQERFLYDVRVADDQPLRIEVDPNRPTRRSVLTLKLIAQPTEYRNERVECHLRRFSADSSRVWDSTRINVDLLLKPRPVTFSFQWQADTITAEIGDTMQLVLSAVTQTLFDEPVEITGHQLDVAYNPTVLVPIARAGQRRVVDRDTLWWRMDAAQRGIIPNGSRTPLDTVYAVVALGDAPYSDLVIRHGIVGIRASDPQIVLADTTTVKVDNIYTYGAGMQRLVSSLKGALRLTISPNPLTIGGTITLYGAEQANARLDIVSIDGSIVATVENMPSGNSRTVAMSNFNLQPGMYYARCLVQRGVGIPPLRIVRMFRYE